MRALELNSLILQERLRRVGPVGLAAVAVGLLAVGVVCAGVLPQWQNVRELRATEADASVQVERIKRGELKIAVKPEQQALDSLRQQLPGQPQASELIERLYHRPVPSTSAWPVASMPWTSTPRPSWRATRSCCRCGVATRRFAASSRACSSNCRPWCWKTSSCNANASATAS